MTAFDSERFASLRRERGLSLGEPLSAVAVTGSTSDDAMAAARAGAPDGATFVADSQTQGRGRRGARWASPPGENLLFSVVLRRSFTPERASTLTLAVGLGLRDALARRVSTPVRIKWPNDLIAADKKLAGILLESQLQSGAIEALVVGIGINVAMRDLPPEIASIATSLALLGAEDLERAGLLSDVLESIDARIRVHEGQGLEPILAELRAHDALLGKRIRVDELAGTASGIAESGALLLRDEAGAEHAVRSGSVELL